MSNTDGSPHEASDPRMVSHSAARQQRRGVGYVLWSCIVLSFSLICIISFIYLFNRQRYDSGTRIWLLNHTPDQVVIYNPHDGVAEKKFQVADGLRGLTFSRDGTSAYIFNVVDVVNKFTSIDTATYLKEESVEVDGVPQGIGTFPGDQEVAVITGSKTTGEAGGFDVLSMTEMSAADPGKKKRLWRVRDLQITHKIAVSDAGDRVYLLDAKSENLSIYDYVNRKHLKDVNLHGAAEDFLYPPAGDFYYISVLQHNTIYQLSKESDEITAAYIYSYADPMKNFQNIKLRHMDIDSQAKYLFAPCYEAKTVAVWEIGSPYYMREPQHVVMPVGPGEKGFIRGEVPYHLPSYRFSLKGGYSDSITFIPGGDLIAVDPAGSFIAITDDEGALYVYDMFEILREVSKHNDPVEIAPHASLLPAPEPRLIITDLLRGGAGEVEIRDLKIARPVVRGKAVDFTDTPVGDE